MLGVHLVATTYGTWLPGDERGHWSPGIGPDGCLVYPVGGPLPGDARTQEWARRQMKQEAVVLSESECNTVAEAFGQVTRAYGYNVCAAAVRPAHVHWVIAQPGDDLGRVVGRYKGVAGKAVRQVRGPGCVWTEGYYKVYLFSERQMFAALHYVEQHNLDVGLPARRWDWVTDWRGEGNDAAEG